MHPVHCLNELGVRELALGADVLQSTSPIDSSPIGAVKLARGQAVADAVERSCTAFRSLRDIPPPVRGELIRRFGKLLRDHKTALAELVTLESGKILQEARGEVQEMIDICDFAVGLSRQLYGLTIASERPGHRLMETWHPLGPVAVISAFNFPVAVWAWNTTLAVVCGDPVVWKPSDKTPLCAEACLALFERALQSMPELPSHICQVLHGGAEVGATLTAHPSVPLVSATGSTAMGRRVAPVVAGRLGRHLLELGGNNAMIVCPSADLGLALPAILFSAVGTCGQRCTSLRRLLVHASIIDDVIGRLKGAYGQLTIGDPRMAETLVGPLIDRAALEKMHSALETARDDGGSVLVGGQALEPPAVPAGTYVRPALVRMPAQTEVVQRETFAPILYAMAYSDLDEAIELQNSVEQGLSSSIFTTDLREAETFVSASGSDCGIANVNVGPSGAEIGGAFGGEKATGGGRESGSDAWKTYMRRATNTINYSGQLPLAQGIQFSVD